MINKEQHAFSYNLGLIALMNGIIALSFASCNYQPFTRAINPKFHSKPRCYLYLAHAFPASFPGSCAWAEPGNEANEYLEITELALICAFPAFVLLVLYAGHFVFKQ